MTEAALPSTFAQRVRHTARIATLQRIERRVPYWPPARVDRLQRFRVARIVRHAYEHVPFYRRAMDARGLHPGQFRNVGDLELLPLISAKDVVRDPTDFVARPFLDHRREIFFTSGSSGLRKQIYLDDDYLIRLVARMDRERAVIAKLADESWVGAVAREFVGAQGWGVLGRVVHRGTAGHQRLSIFPADFSSRTLRGMWNERTLIPRKALHRHHLYPHASFEETVDCLNDVGPRVVFSFGSYVDHFLREVAASGRDVSLPRVWVYLGDMISAEGRRLAEERFGISLVSAYGAMEACTIGFQCEQRSGFHLNIDLCGLRLINDDGHTVADGEPGEVVISGLDNRATVLLNYRLGDLGVMGRESCVCGRSLPLLSRMEGRRSEVVVLPDGRRVSSLTLEAMFGRELARTVQTQLDQSSAGELRWRVVAAPGVAIEELRRDFQTRNELLFGTQAKLTIDFVERIERTAAGKFVGVIGAPAAGRRL